MMFLLRVLVTLILAQTLFFKFSGASESVYIFSQLHLEPYGRLGAGIAELTACILLWIPKFRLAGSVLCLFMMLNAVFLHIFVLGISIQNDHGLLFVMAIIAAVASGILVYHDKKQRR